MSERTHRCRPRKIGSLVLLTLGLALGAAAHAQTPPRPAADATLSGTAWPALTSQQQSALAPLKSDWHNIDATRRQKWLEIAARLQSLPPAERQRIQDRMSEWARMTPDERVAVLWDTVLEEQAWRGVDADQLRLQRSVVRIQRP